MIETRTRVLGGAILTQFTVIGLLFSWGLFFRPLEAEFGWTRTQVSGAPALGTLMMGTLAIVAGRLNDRLGPRRVLLVSGTAFGVGYMLMSQVTAAWQLYAIFGVLLGMGLATHDVVTLSTIARWYERRRGIMSGVVKVGTAVGQMSLPPIAAWLLLTQGWRSAALVLGLAGLVLLVLAALAMDRPALELTPVKAGAAPSGPDGISFAEARRGRVFWTLGAVQFLFFSTMMTVPTHLPAHGQEIGLTPAGAAILLTVLGAASILGRLSVGYLSDRIGGKRTFAACLTVLLISLVALTVVKTPTLLFIAVALYGACHGGLFVVVSPLVAEIFGMRAHGAIFGSILFFGTLGGAIGPIAAGRVFDLTGGYALAFGTLAVLAAAALALVLTLPARR